MKNIKRMISCFLVFLHLVLCAVPVCASTGLPEIEMEDNAELKSPDVIAIETAVEQYFEQREHILSEKEGDISRINDWNRADEEKHLVAMKNRDVVRNNAILIIDTVSINEKYATVLATEVLEYSIGDNLYHEEIDHVYIVGKTGLSRIVIDDRYYEQASGFASCSYIAPDSPGAILAVGDGSALCVVRVAQNEIGYTEEDDGWTKYGYWALPSYPAVEWCVAFVSWCANRADVPTSVIPKETSAGPMRDFFINRGLYLYSYSYGGSTLPQAGDIVFFSWSEGAISHAAIVTGTDNTYVYLVEGNNADNPPGVDTNRYNLYSGSILGYGRPNYQAQSHTRFTAWAFSATHHWRSCENCGTAVNYAEHSFEEDPDTGISTCILCGYEVS